MFTQNADFRQARFEQRTRVRFDLVNKDGGGLRARFLNCPIEGVSFADAHWHRYKGRIVLQDELDITSGEHDEYGLVGVAYRQFVNTFDSVRNYDLAEDCYIGAMEMRRHYTENFLFGRIVKVRAVYKKFPPARKLGEWVSVLNVYRLSSNYGSSYTRALSVLGVMMLVFALLFPLFGLRTAEPSPSVGLQTSSTTFCPEAASISWCKAWVNKDRVSKLWGTFKGGVLATAEVASFQRRPTLEPATTWGKGMAILETIFVPAQVALFLLALRRRFKR